MYYIRVTEGKNATLKTEGRMRKSILIFHLHRALCLPEGVHKILKTLAPIGAENSVTEISTGEKEK